MTEKEFAQRCFEGLMEAMKLAGEHAEFRFSHGFMPNKEQEETFYQWRRALEKSCPIVRVMAQSIE